MRVCASVVVTFGLGGHFERCGALSLAVAIVGHNPEAVFGVRHEVLDGDLHLPRTAGVHHSLPDVDTHITHMGELRELRRVHVDTSTLSR